MPTNRTRRTRGRRAKTTVPDYIVEWFKSGTEPDPKKDNRAAWGLLKAFSDWDGLQALWAEEKGRLARSAPFAAPLMKDRARFDSYFCRDYVSQAIKYAEGVAGGSIPACKWIRKAGQRFLEDLARAGSGRFPYVFDGRKAAYICRFIELLPHIKGKWAGTSIKLEPWQIFIICNVFGWIDPNTGLRRFKTIYIEVPRKNAKSTLSSGILLFCLVADDEGGPECYSAATTRDQAKIVFKVAQAMAKRSPGLVEHYGLNVKAHEMETDAEGLCKPLSADGDTLDGLNISCAIVDELHAHKTREVHDVIETATGSREQPIFWEITTAGSNRAGICYEQRGYVVKVLDGVVDDETIFGVIYTIDNKKKWADPGAWAEANPNFGVSVKPEDIERKAKKARVTPAAKNNFLTKHLDVWVHADESWMDVDAWRKCGDPSLRLEDFEGDPVWIGVDLASRVDIASMALLFIRDGIYYCFVRNYLPKDTVEQAKNSQYPGWSDAGHLIVTAGAVTDIDQIEKDILDFAERFRIQCVAYDPYQATQMANRLTDAGLLDEDGNPLAVEVRPTVMNFSEPMKEIGALVLKEEFKHNADPVFTWMVSNVVCHYDKKDNIYPNKEKPENKIDGVVASIMALNRAINDKDDNGEHEQAFVEI